MLSSQGAQWGNWVRSAAVRSLDGDRREGGSRRRSGRRGLDVALRDMFHSPFSDLHDRIRAVEAERASPHAAQCLCLNFLGYRLP